MKAGTVERNDGTKSCPWEVVWEHFTIQRTWAEAVLADAEKEKQESIQGKWQMESPFKEVLDW